MVAGAVQQLGPPGRSVVMSKNVGNRVCEAIFDLDEQHEFCN